MAWVVPRRQGRGSLGAASGQAGTSRAGPPRQAGTGIVSAPGPQGPRRQEAAVDSMRVGFVGAGRMGMPMVERLAAARHDLVVYARRAEAKDALTGLGVRHVSELAEAAAGVDVLLLCLFSDSQLAEVA